MNSPYLFVDLPPSRLHPWPPSRIDMTEKPLTAEQIDRHFATMPAKYRRRWELLVAESVRPGIPREVTCDWAFRQVLAQFRKDQARREAKAAPGLFGEIVPVKKRKRTALPDLA